MIFEDEKYNSKYDIGNMDLDEEYNFADLSKAIVNTVNSIQDDLKHGPVKLKHPDNNGSDIFLYQLIPDDIYNRTPTDISNLLKRKDRPSIVNYLNKWGIDEPADEISKREYLKLLYLLYMVQYILFPEENNVLGLLNKNITTNFSPIKNASNGKYLTFILSVLFDDEDTLTRIANEDNNIELQIFNISKVLDKILTPDNPNVNKDIAEMKVPRLITSIRNRLPEIRTDFDSEQCEDGIITKAADYIYQYTNTSYVHEMIKNMREKNLFCFDDIDETISPELKKQLFSIEKTDDYMGFIRTPEVRKFYKKGDGSDNPKYTEAFLSNIIDYDLEQVRKFNEGVWIIEKGDNYYISGDTLSMIMRTFCDLGSKHTFHHDIKIGKKKWEHSLSYRKTLAYLYPDIAMRLFMLAYESECIIRKYTKGGYHMFFKPLCLENHILIQEIMENTFRIDNPDSRSKYLLRILNEIIITNQGF